MKIPPLKIGTRQFRWVLFLGVIPFEKASLTIYRSKPVGNALSYLLILFTALITCMCMIQIKNIPAGEKKKLIQNISLIFVFMLVIYATNGLLNNNLQFTRLLSLFTLWIFYVFAVLGYRKPQELLRDLSKACLFLTILSLVLYLTNNRNVYYQESATLFSFKGVALNRNGFIEFALFPIVYYWYLAIKGGLKDKIVSVIISIVSLYAIIITRSATSIVCLVVLFPVLVFRKSIQKYLSLKIFYIVYSIIFILVVLLESSSAVNYISSLLGRSNTLTGRTSFWPITLDLIAKKPILGYGIDTTVLYDIGIRENDPHNGMLYLLLTSGCIGGIIFILLIVNHIKAAKMTLKSNDLVYCVNAYIMSWLVRGIVESSFSYTHYIFWVSIITIFLIYYEKPLFEKREDIWQQITASKI